MSCVKCDRPEYYLSRYLHHDRLPMCRKCFTEYGYSDEKKKRDYQVFHGNKINEKRLEKLKLTSRQD